MPTKVFFVEKISRQSYSQTFKCAACSELTRVAVGDIEGDEKPDLGDWDLVTRPCQKCGHSARLWATSASPYYRRVDTGEVIGGPDKLPPGSCYDAAWLHDYPEYCGPDGRSLNVVLPQGSHWGIDSRCSNCTLPGDKAHKCWVRHGRPEDGTLHVDKNGVTCAAGAGSIVVTGYHGFLHNGHLTDNM